MTTLSDNYARKDHWDKRSNESRREYPVDADRYYERGNELRREGKLLAALVCFNKAVELRPTFAAALFYKAVTCAALDNRLTELQAYRQFLSCARPEDAVLLPGIRRRINQLTK